MITVLSIEESACPFCVSDSRAISTERTNELAMCADWMEAVARALVAVTQSRVLATCLALSRVMEPSKNCSESTICGVRQKEWGEKGELEWRKER